jgi:valyl-tRNA synthetase
VGEITENLDKFELGIAVQKLYDFLWDEFCDWYIEISKIRLNSGDEQAAQAARRVLVWVMTGTLQLLHPFMPFITEEIWQTLPHEGESIMVSKWPEPDASHSYPEAAQEMAKIMEAVRAVRNRRSEMNVPPSRRTHLSVDTASQETFRDGSAILERLAYASRVEIGTGLNVPDAVTIVTPDAKLLIPTDDLVDRKAERARLSKELDSAQKQLATAEAKLKNEKFLSRAPQNVVEGVRQNAAKLKDQIKLIQSSLVSL